MRRVFIDFESLVHQFKVELAYCLKHENVYAVNDRMVFPPIDALEAEMDWDDLHYIKKTIEHYSVRGSPVMIVITNIPKYVWKVRI